MEVKKNLTLKLPDFEKCALMCDDDIPLGQLFDYACALKNFVAQKIVDHQKAEEANKPAQPDMSDDQAPEVCQEQSDG